LRILSQVDPDKATQLREAYKDERHVNDILDLPN